MPPAMPPDFSSQDLFDFLLANAPDQVYFKDREGRFIRISQAVAKCLGVADAAEVIGKTDFDFWDEETARAAAADERRVMETGEPLVGKIEQLRHPGGQVVWDYTTKLPLRDSHGKIIGICGINKDFTKLKEMEDALRDERNQLRITTAELEARNAQVEADLLMAREVQEALLPRNYRSVSPPAHCIGAPLAFTHFYLPAAAVGGDFFHVFPLADDRVGVFQCDVMGHGLRAALITAVIRALLEELRPGALDPGEFLGALNKRVRVILRRIDEPFVATAFFVIADPAAGELRFSNAAHPVPVRLRAGEGVIGRLENEGGKAGPALGLFDEASYQTVVCPFGENDRVVLFTDGIYEVDSAENEEFGEGRLLESCGSHAALPAKELFDAVLNDVRQFAAKPEFDDDVCLLAFERAGS